MPQCWPRRWVGSCRTRTSRSSLFMAISRRTAHSPIWPGGWTQAAISPSVQGVVALRALGQAPKNNPAPVMDRFFVNDAYKRLPWYAISFFPLFYAALGRPFPKPYDKALRDLLIASQTEDGYLGDHLAATFHMAHYFRLVGEPTPRARKMVERVLRSQKPDCGRP